MQFTCLLCGLVTISMDLSHFESHGRHICHRYFSCLRVTYLFSWAVIDITGILGYTFTGQKIKMWIVDCRLEAPAVPAGTYGVRDNRVWPTEARQRGCSYKGRCVVRAGYSIDGVTQPVLEKSLGNLPIMLGSDACNLRGLTPAQLIERGEQVCRTSMTFGLLCR